MDSPCNLCEACRASMRAHAGGFFDSKQLGARAAEAADPRCWGAPAEIYPQEPSSGGENTQPVLYLQTAVNVTCLTGAGSVCVWVCVLGIQSTETPDSKWQVQHV